MKILKSVYLLIMVFILTNCNGKQSKEKLNISDFVSAIDSYESFKNENDINFEKNTDYSYGNLILCNMPFKLIDDYKLYIYFNNKLVYNKNLDDSIKVPITITEGEIINVKIVIASDSKVYILNNKYTFKYSHKMKNYYLSFLPFNDSEYRFILVPSEEYIS